MNADKHVLSKYQILDFSYEVTSEFPKTSEMTPFDIQLHVKFFLITFTSYVTGFSYFPLAG